MITREELQGHWNQLKGQIQEKWGSLTDDDLSQAKGNTNQLVGVIQQKTGETRQAIEKFLDDALATGGNMVGQAAEKAREYAGQAADAAREYAGQASETMRRGYEQVASRFNEGFQGAQETVRSRPVESVAVAFGAGLIAGVITGLILRSR